MPCPACGSMDRTQLEPGLYVCENIRFWNPVYSGGLPGVIGNRCRTRYRDGSISDGVCAVCKNAAVEGRCDSCGTRLCRLHSEFRVGKRLCVQHTTPYDHAALVRAEQLFWAGLPADPLDRYVELLGEPLGGSGQEIGVYPRPEHPYITHPDWGDWERVEKETERALAALGGPLGAGSGIVPAAHPL